MQDEQTAEWLALSDAQFAEIRDKIGVILHSLPELIDRWDGTARATLSQRDSRAIETLSRKRLVDALLSYAETSLQQSEYMRGLLGTLDSTWRCLDAVRSAYRAQQGDEPAARPPGEGGDEPA